MNRTAFDRKPREKLVKREKRVKTSHTEKESKLKCRKTRNNNM